MAKKKPSELGKRIQTLRKGARLTQVELSKKVGVNQSSISALERGDTKKGFGLTLVKIAVVLGVDSEWLVTGEVTKPVGKKDEPLEQEILSIYNSLDSQMQAAWLAAGRSLVKSRQTVSKEYRSRKPLKV